MFNNSMVALASETHHAKLARIMIVEDEGIIAGHIATRLEKTGYAVAGVFGSSEEALEKIPELLPDLILMDIRINGAIDGIETAHRVRETFDIPVIYLTAHTDRQTIDRAKKTGSFGFLTKPVHHTSLAISIEMALHKHQTERQVREQRAWIETVLDSMADAVVVVDSGWKVRFLNRPAETLTGWKNNEACDFDLSLILQGLDQEDELPSDDAVRQLPDGVVAVSRSGQRLPVEGEIAASFDNGRPMGRILTLRDPSLRRELEHRKRQEEKMQAVGRLAAGIAHDFNNLLFLVLGYAEQLLAAAGPGSPSHAPLAQIRRAAETAVGITRQLVQYGRPDSGEPTDVALNDLIYETEELWRRLAGGAVMWETKLDPGVGTIRADPSQMKQVLMNLIANARDAMPRGGVLTIETASAGADTILLIVKDTGVGIPPESIDRLFEPYFTTKGGGAGTGLGLSIVHRIVSDLGGTIQVDSQVSRGTAFTVRLPLRRMD